MENNLKYLEEKFTRVFDKLDDIHTQTSKTNGRVNELEKQVNNLKLEDANHLNKCPQQERIKELEKTANTVNFIIKYPKLTLVGILGLIMLGAISLKIIVF